ncbi:CLUMA_CG019195, isoform A [Clunio marinus]|uniref:CLUMA_CG019195, isoform A n=1 Tax=Clunio marinus TaxID=568069 RepID=A0A1J1J2R4_9DIPT|nr:CLUMA_CG019195, isoform A [Clunio marinus]
MSVSQSIELNGTFAHLWLSLILYLNNPKTFNKTYFHNLIIETKASTVKYGIELIKRIFPDKRNVVDSSDSEVEEDVSSYSLEKRLKISVESFKKPGEPAGAGDSLKRDFQFFDRHEQRTPTLEKLFAALCTIPPTSTQSE